MYCANKSHAPHLTTGVVDCHFGQESSTQSEIVMAEVCETLGRARDLVKKALAEISLARSIPQVVTCSAEAERAISMAETAYARVPDALTWAGVTELPGMAGESNQKRYKSIEALTELVRNNRRPPTDLATAQRSLLLCGEMAKEAHGLIGEVRSAATEIKVTVNNWRAPEPTPEQPQMPAQVVAPVSRDRTPEKIQADKERMARLRARKKQAEPTAA